MERRGTKRFDRDDCQIFNSGVSSVEISECRVLLTQFYKKFSSIVYVSIFKLVVLPGHYSSPRRRIESWVKVRGLCQQLIKNKWKSIKKYS